MSELATLPVKTYRVVNDWTKQVIMETKVLEEACNQKAEEERKNKHDQISVVAVIEVGP